MDIKTQLTKIASELKEKKAILVSKDIEGLDLLKKVAFVRINTYNAFLRKKR
jgi:hypothetical protein